MFDNIGDVLLNAFVKIRKPDDRFVEMRESVDKLEENLNMVSRLYARISKRQSGMIFILFCLGWRDRGEKVRSRMGIFEDSETGLMCLL